VSDLGDLAVKPPSESRPFEDIEDLLHACNRCGFCQVACPVYLATGREWDVTRGRIQVVRAVAEGELALGPEIDDPLTTCLLCRCCIPHCPPEVRIAEIIVRGREERLKQDGLPWLGRFVLDRILPDRTWIKVAAAAVRMGRAARIPAAAMGLDLDRRLGGIGKALMMLPPAAGAPVGQVVRRRLRPPERPRARVALLVCCGTYVAFPQVVSAAVEVLQRNHVEVVIPETPCFGLPAWTAGDVAGARALARRTIDAIRGLDVDFYVVENASCGAFVHDYRQHLAGDATHGELAEMVSAKTRDLSQFLVEVGFERPTRSVEATATFHDPCHLSNYFKQTRPPREILRSIPGLTFREALESDACCGSAGTYWLKHPDISEAILDRKLRHLMDTGATIIATQSPACSMQLIYGLRRRGLETRVVHPVELLAQAYRSSPTPDPQPPALGLTADG